MNKIKGKRKNIKMSLKTTVLNNLKQSKKNKKNLEAFEKAIYSYHLHNCFYWVPRVPGLKIRICGVTYFNSTTISWHTVCFLNFLNTAQVIWNLYNVFPSSLEMRSNIAFQILPRSSNIMATDLLMQLYEQFIWRTEDVV